MNITINNDYKTAFGIKYVVLGKQNKSVPFLYNKVVDTIKGKGVSTLFDMGKDTITLSVETKEAEKSILDKFKEFGIKTITPKETKV